MSARRTGRLPPRADKEIAARVKALMTEKLWEQKDLALQLDLSEGYVSRILSGERPWPIPILIKAAEALAVPIHALDAGLEQFLLSELYRLEMRRDTPQLAALQTFVHTLPQITAPEDLEAVSRVLEAFSSQMREE